jgi:DNA-binding response OmpR family regulator
MAVVLVIEDERDIRDVLRRYLERESHSVLSCGTGAEGLRLLHEGAPDLVLLDLGLPDIDGLEILDAATAIRIPVIALTARTAVEDRIDGLQRGADDYVTKPFSPKEVVLRVAAVLGRGAPSPTPGPSVFGDGRLSIDLERHEALVRGRAMDLTPSEWGILVALASRPGRVYSRLELVNRVRGYAYEGYERTIDSHVKNLRHKLDDPEIVETVVGVGYRLGLSHDQ